MPYSHFAGWVKRKHWSLSISCTIILYAQLLSLLPLLLSSWHRPRLHKDAFCHEEALSSLRCDWCSGHSEGEGHGSRDELCIINWRARGEKWVRVPRYHGWTTLAPECSAWCLHSACSVQKTACVFHFYQCRISCQLKAFPFLKKITRFDHSLLGISKLASVCSIWNGGEKHQSRTGKERKRN